MIAKTILFALVLGIAGVLIFAATKPDTFAVQRSAAIAAPPDKLFALINDLRTFNTWNPYTKKDANIKLTYSGPAAGPGARFDFAGNKEAGTGSIEVLQASAATQVAMQLVMVEPFPVNNRIEFTLAPQSNTSGAAPATQVTWAMRGDSPYFAKVMQVFFSMDKMVGKDFEAGLANLKTLAEAKTN